MGEPTTPPPDSDTGVEMPTVGLGWLRGTVRVDPQVVMDALRPYFGQSQTRPFGVRWYGSAPAPVDRSGGLGRDAARSIGDDRLGWHRRRGRHDARGRDAGGARPSGVGNVARPRGDAA